MNVVVPSVVTLNVHGVIDDNKRNILFQYCKVRNFDVVFLQETHCYDINNIKSGEKNGVDQIIGRLVPIIVGVGILFSSKLIFKLQFFQHDFDGRLVSVSVTLGGESSYIFTNIYCPNNEHDRKSFISGLKRYLHGSHINVLGRF